MVDNLHQMRTVNHTFYTIIFEKFHRKHLEAMLENDYIFDYNQNLARYEEIHSLSNNALEAKEIILHRYQTTS